ncbi:MAG: hypothetical protein F6K21_28610 [Symploca sp. SIO2D2]|nr:hypothetical protein [Symploca sp. SIO2D2]
MNYRTIKLSAALVATVASLVGFSSVARAGEGGAAGAAAFTVNTGAVTGAAVSSALGKDGAAAHSTNYATAGSANEVQNSASAVGASGGLTFTNSLTNGSSFVTNQETDTGRAVGQANTFTTGAGPNVNIGTTTGSTVVDY